MAAPVVKIVKVAANLLADEKTRKVVSGILVAVISLVLAIVTLICSIGAGAAEHNNQVAALCFNDADYPAEMPDEYKIYIDEMRSAFSALSELTETANTRAQDGAEVDLLRVQSVFFSLYFGGDGLTDKATEQFVLCFYEEIVIEEDGDTDSPDEETDSDPGSDTEETDGETESVAAIAALPLEQVYANLADELGRIITETEQANVEQVYQLAQTM